MWFAERWGLSSGNIKNHGGCTNAIQHIVNKGGVEKTLIAANVLCTSPLAKSKHFVEHVQFFAWFKRHGFIAYNEEITPQAQLSKGKIIKRRQFNIKTKAAAWQGHNGHLNTGNIFNALITFVAR